MRILLVNEVNGYEVTWSWNFRSSFQVISGQVPFLKFYKLAEIRAFLLKISFRTGTSAKRTQISSGYTTNGPKSKKTVAKSLTTDFQILQPKNAITENNRKKITENIKSVEELYRLWILAMLQPKRFSKNSLNRERPNLFFALWPILMAHNLGYGISWPWTNTE